MIGSDREGSDREGSDVDMMARIYVIVVSAVVMLAIGGTVAIVALAWSGREPPAALITITATCVGSLVSFLIPLSASKNGREGLTRKDGSV